MRPLNQAAGIFRLKNVLEGLRSSEFYCPGSILRVDVDTSNPIARTMLKDTDAYFVNSSAFEATDRDRVQSSRDTRKERILRSGWLLGEDKIKDKIALAEIPMGKGRVVVFGFRPQHRGQTWGTFPFIWNSLNCSTVKLCVKNKLGQAYDIAILLSWLTLIEDPGRRAI